jgi:uncharacterized membrane protein
LPILITLWVIYWLYSTLEKYVIDPLGGLILWKARLGQSGAELPLWFENYAAPVLAVVLAFVLLYVLGFVAQSRSRRLVEWVLLRVPVISIIYNAVRNVFQALEKQGGQKRSERVVLIAFPHPGIKAVAFVTATCRDTKTGKDILCVYIPTSPVPTSGYFLLVPEDEVVEANWNSEQSLQTIISGGLTAPTEVNYFETKPALAASPDPAPSSHRG